MPGISNSLANSLASSLGNSLSAAAGTAPVANAGVDASHNRFYGAAYTLAGSATGTAPVTYQWTKVAGSGTPVPTFTDATNPTTTVTFDVAGSVTLRLTATNAFGSHSDDVVINVTATAALHGLASAPSALWCPGVCLVTAYAGGVAFRVRRASDDAETNINYTANGVADLAALTAHCVGTNGFLVTPRDSSGNTRDVTNATKTQQHKIYDSVTGPVLVNGYLAALGAGSDDNMARADASGISGTNAKSAAWCGRPAAAAAGTTVLFGSTVGASVRFQMYVGGTATILGTQLGTTSFREFTATDYTAAMQRLVMRLQASGTQGQVKLNQNGSALVESSSFNPATASNTAATASQVLGASTAAANNYHCASAAWTADISDADAALWNTALATFYP